MDMSIMMSMWFLKETYKTKIKNKIRKLKLKFFNFSKKEFRIISKFLINFKNSNNHV